MTVNVLIAISVLLCVATTPSERRAAGERSAASGISETRRRNVSEWPVACVTKEAVAGRAPSLLPKGKTLALVWHDEFEGAALDTSVWHYRTNFWGHRFATYADHGATVSNGVLRLPLMFEDGVYKSVQLQTGANMWDNVGLGDPTKFWPFPKREKARFLMRYGYFECRARLQRQPGWWSAFWLQSESIGTTDDGATSGVEADVMESFEPGLVCATQFFSRGYGPGMRAFTAERIDWSRWDDGQTIVDKDAFHTFGLLWEPDGYTVFIDGRQKGHKVGKGEGEDVSHVPQFLLLSCECQEYRTKRMTGNADPRLAESYAKGDDFVVDFVRVYALEM